MTYRGRRCYCAAVGVWMLLLGGALSQSLASSRTCDCDTTDGWIVLDRNLQPVGDTPLSAADGRLIFEYSRDALRYLTHLGTDLVSFNRLSIRLRSSEEVMLGVALRDRDGARFFAMRSFPGNEWGTLEFSPADFQLAETSPVDKARLDPELAESSYVLFDIGSFAGFASGSNTVEIERDTKSAED